MKQFIAIIFAVVYSWSSYAQSSNVQGYYITNANDSIQATIKLPTQFFSKSILLSGLLSKVEMTDSVNGNKTWRPKDVTLKSFGFNYKGIDYRFYSPSCSKSFNRFLQAVVLGTNTNLYVYQTVDEQQRPLGAIYTLEKADGTCMFLNIAEPRLEMYRKKLKEFYNQKPELKQLIEKRFTSRVLVESDIREIVQAVNQLK